MNSKLRVSWRSALGQSRIVFVLASVALLVPCYWQSRVQAGDLASHLYNAWLAELVDSGRAPGLRIAWQTTNVLFDLILGALFRSLGAGPAERIAVGLAVLVFAWGAFAFVSAVAGRRAWELLPCIAMLAYGWVFHIGFFNFYLGLGLSFSALALTWNGAPARMVFAAPILALAWLAHALPVAWAIALVAFSWLWRRLPSRLRPAALLTAIALLGLASVVISHTLVSSWTAGQAVLITGADQLRVFDRKYEALAFALIALWLILIVTRTRSEGIRAALSRLEPQLWILCAAGVLIVPGMILPRGYGHALVYITERMSLTAAVLTCAVVASPRPSRFGSAFALIAVVFFTFLYRDERILNRFEDQLDEIVAQLPPDQRVILGVRDPTLRVNALAHMIDRACIGRCYSYANYEPSTRQFRIRVEGPNPIVASTYQASSAMQRGGYLVQASDLPLYQVGLEPNGKLGVRSLQAGERSGMTLLDLHGNEGVLFEAESP